MIDLFAGCGGLSLGFMNAGFEVVGFIENWKPAIQTHLKNFPDSEHIGFDIRDVKEEVLKKYVGNVDVIVGGPPCQGFSFCGNRNPKDKRNTLYKEFLRIIGIIKPNFVVIENVAGILSMKNNDSEKVISVIMNSLVSLGYFVCYKKLKAVDFGIPQKRERIIIIAKKCRLYPKQTPNKKLCSIDAIQNIPNYISGHVFSNTTEEVIEKIKILKQGCRLSDKFNFSRQRMIADKPALTIATQQCLIHPYKNRFLTPREVARLQSFPDSFELCGTLTAMNKQVGNAVPPVLAKIIADKIFQEVNENEA